ncbi:MAG TPA: UDP-N-acetylglucosamine 2-epimerase (non-hydrolyzing) [Nitrososphaeraceae archaeon]|jgi:UDP-N-acetylglucosamine 2-epimerase (non-hydrolysing)
MNKIRVVSVVGARPNFIKLAPIHQTLCDISAGNSINHSIVHTGQHYDYNLSKIFFKEFGIPKPEFELEVGSGTPGYQIGEMVKKIEKVFLENFNEFDLALVYGDTNSTIAGAIAARSSGLKIAHVESGLRSFDRRMPEEINRVLTDHISDYLFAPTMSAVRNLEREHVFGKIIYTGDISVEIVNKAAKLFENRSSILNYLELRPKSFILFTMHRDENTSSQESLASVIHAFEILSGSYVRHAAESDSYTIVFPIHPRTAKLLKDHNLYARLEKCKNLKIIEPVGYLDFLNLMQNAIKVITDSGGAQKEAYLLGVPCITIRRNTEWLETVNEGWNLLTDTDTNRIVEAVKNWSPSIDHPFQNKTIFGDGRTSIVIRSFIGSIA